MKLHRLNLAGLERFQGFLDTQGTGSEEAHDPSLLSDPRYIERAGTGPEVPDSCPYASRMEVASFLHKLIEQAQLSEPDHDRGVWSWISWLWFPSLCPKGKDGRFKPGHPERWLLNLSYAKYYRHLLAGPWFIYRTHRDDPQRALALLCQPITTPGELVGQIAASQQLVSSPGIVGAATQLYYDPQTGKPKKGHSGKGAGTPRRLRTIAKQLETIWDLSSVKPEELISLLPSEFDKFRGT